MALSFGAISKNDIQKIDKYQKFMHFREKRLLRFSFRVTLTFDLLILHNDSLG